eukprot:m.168277 g.168277  ORF g.168277 m.168277 type:complete len:252 (+) comp17212_c1_seq1:1792-2547(+)
MQAGTRLLYGGGAGDHTSGDASGIMGGGSMEVDARPPSSLERAVYAFEGSGVLSVAFSPDGRRIAAGLWRKTVCMWTAPSSLPGGANGSGGGGGVVGGAGVGPAVGNGGVGKGVVAAAILAAKQAAAAAGGGGSGGTAAAAGRRWSSSGNSLDSNSNSSNGHGNGSTNSSSSSSTALKRLKVYLSFGDDLQKVQQARKQACANTNIHTDVHRLSAVDSAPQERRKLPCPSFMARRSFFSRMALLLYSGSLT